MDVSGSVVHTAYDWGILKLNNIYYRTVLGEGIDVMAADWDNLIILDACRHDFLNQLDPFDPLIEKIISKGGHSWKFMEYYFNNKTYHDTIYVSANPHTPEIEEGVFYKREYLYDEWDQDIGTVLPKSVTKRAIEEYNSHPNKRMVIHYMQPHAPYLGPTSDVIRERANIRGWHKDKMDNSGDMNQSDAYWDQATSFDGVTKNHVRKAYLETLEIVVEEFRNLLMELPGKTVLTADHGQLLGERFAPFTPERYGHPDYFYRPELYEVPWVEFSTDERRTICHDEPIAHNTVDEAGRKERLRALGYSD